VFVNLTVALMQIKFKAASRPKGLKPSTEQIVMQLGNTVYRVVTPARLLSSRHTPLTKARMTICERV